MSNSELLQRAFRKWRWWVGPLLVTSVAYFAGFYSARNYTHVTYIVGGRLRTVHLASLARNKMAHRALVCLYFPFVLSDAAEFAPSFGYLPAKSFPDDYPPGSTFYLSGDEIREALDADQPPS